MERIWLSSYPQGVPADIDASAYDSLIPFYEESFEKFCDQPAYESISKRLTFGDIDKMSLSVAAWLQGQKLHPGDRVAIMMPNILQYPIIVAAILRAGYVVVNINPLYTPRELEHQLKDSGAKIIFILKNFVNTLKEVITHTQIKTVVAATVGDMLGFPKGLIINYMIKKRLGAGEIDGAIPFTTALKNGASMPYKKPDLKPEDIAVLQYTGGTTGVSKGAMLSHRALLSGVLSTEAWVEPKRKAANLPPNETIICVTALPLYHVFAFVTCSLCSLRIGSMCLLIANPRDPKHFIRDLRKHKVHVFPAVSTLFNTLLHDPDFAKLDFSRLFLSNGGGMAVQQSVADEWHKVTGLPIIEGYGLSETCSGITCNPVMAEKFTGTIGVPMPNVEIKFLDDDGHEVKLGEAGEIAFRGPQLMSGYWGMPEETALVMTKDGFFKTGDIGVMDEKGFIRLMDRKKDMINVSGFNVYPNEIEGVVMNHPGVRECAVVGVPDPNSGETVLLYVEKKDPNLTKEDLMSYFKHELTGYKKPRRIIFRNEIPKSNVGKILRRELRDEALKEAAQNSGKTPV